MGKYFGTDGIRGEAGRELTAALAFRLGQVLAGRLRGEGKRPRALIGKDTRLSSYMLEYAVSAGLASAGADVYLLHVTTTPSVSYLVRTEGFDFGIMISASHNPYRDNGIKVLSGRGEKLSDGECEAVESLIDSGESFDASGEDIGRISDYSEGRQRYIGYLTSLTAHSLRPLSVGIDAANGASYLIARSVFEALGARVVMMGDVPNGRNIGDGVGSTHPEALSELVLRDRLDLGFAFDGDADRCIAVDGRGRIFDGDRIMYALALSMKERGELSGERIVTTVMSNLGLFRALSSRGIGYEVTAVGDRYVYERMCEGGYSLGGEASGHIILSKYATTGDGILTAIKLSELLIESGKPLSKYYDAVVSVPQLTRSVRVSDKSVIDRPEVVKAAEGVREGLGDSGRLILRASGTEPVIRITVEAASEDECLRHINNIEEAIRGCEA